MAADDAAAATATPPPPPGGDECKHPTAHHIAIFSSLPMSVSSSALTRSVAEGLTSLLWIPLGAAECLRFLRF